MLFKIVLSFALICAAVAVDSEITKFMKHLEVIPDVLDEGPKDFLKVCMKQW